MDRSGNLIEHFLMYIMSTQSRAILLFEQAIKSDATRTNYLFHLNKFKEYYAEREKELKELEKWVNPKIKSLIPNIEK